MQWQNTSYIVLLVTAAVILVLPAILLWRLRPAPGKTPLILLMLAVTEWSISYAFELGSATLPNKIFWGQVKYLGIVTTPGAWLLFAIQYTRKETWLRPRTLILLAIEPLITLLLVCTNSLHGLIWSSTGIETGPASAMRVSTHGAGFWGHAVYSYLLLFLGSILIIRTLIRSPHLYRGQTIGLLIGMLAPWAGNALYIYDLSPFPNLDLTPFAFTLTGEAFALSLFRFRLLDIVPVAHDAIIKSMSDMVIVLDMKNRIVDINPVAKRAISSATPKIIGEPAEKILSNWPDLVEQYRKATETRSEISLQQGETKLHFDLRISPLKDRQGHLHGRLIVLHDITERKQAEEKLQKAHDELEERIKERTAELVDANEQLRQEIEDRKRAEAAVQESLALIGRIKREWESTADSLPQIICLLDHKGCVLRTNRTVERWNIERVVNVKGRRIHELLHPNCKDPFCYLEAFWPQAWEELTSGRSAECEAEDTIIGRYVHVQARPIAPQTYQKGEETDSFAVAVLYDITEQKRAERNIAALEEQLRHSQKMEAIGRLAGGVAHDFNNLMTVISGYSQLTLLDFKEGNELRENLQEIQRASKRAEDLTRQLLAFTRHQIMDIKVLDLNSLLHNLDKMLRRVLGEDIELISVLAEGLGRVKIDPGQIEQVLLNLAINARDAMPNGGKLIIESGNVELDEGYGLSRIGVTPGPYVMLSMTDTGCGMSPEVKEHIFEPFYTTKETGKGTGLGLSTVYGIVKQSGGNIWVYSELGKGTTFKIYLPLVDEPLNEMTEKGAAEGALKGSETILTVEDDGVVRKLAARILKTQGYKVFEASHGEEALKVAKEHAGDRIHLLLTDVVMPGISGPELVESLLLLHPETKVIYMSGYTDNAIIHQGVLKHGVNYIQKPFTPDSLARKVREVLDRGVKGHE